MNKPLVAGIAAILASLSFAAIAPAQASDFVARCVAISSNDTLPEGMSQADLEAGCACLAAAAEADPTVAADLEPALSIEDYEARMASVGPAGQAALSSCSP